MVVWKELSPHIPEHTIVELKIGLELIDTYVVGDVLELRLFKAVATDERHHLSTRFKKNTWVRSYPADKLDYAIKVFNHVKDQFAAAAIMGEDIDIREMLDGTNVGGGLDFDAE